MYFNVDGFFFLVKKNFFSPKLKYCFSSSIIFHMSLLEYLGTNLPLIIITIIIISILATSVYFRKMTVITFMVVAFLLVAFSVVNYIEEYLSNLPTYSIWRAILTALKYSIPPFIFASIGLNVFDPIFKYKHFIYAPALLLLILCIISIPTGIVFYFLENGFQRGVLGYLPFIISALYLAFVLFVLVNKISRNVEDILPIVLISLFVISALVFPLVLQEYFEKWNGTLMAASVLMFCIYLLQQFAKKDQLTNLLNRQSLYNDADKGGGHHKYPLVIFIDMNGLKKINDSKGHTAGDAALIRLARSLVAATVEEYNDLATNIKNKCEENKVEVSIGYCIRPSNMTFDEAYKLADQNMYEEKKQYYDSLNK